MAEPVVAGLLLAAGAGRRFGGPKALATVDGETFLRRSLRVLRSGGCDPVRVVLGARADAARELLDDPAIAVHANEWATGMGASLRAGLHALGELNPAPDAVLVHLVDLLWAGTPVIARLTAAADIAVPAEVVARAAYEGKPGHPVLFGRRWWPEIAEAARGDRGARDWLAGRADVTLVECGDVGSGVDVDAPADLIGRDPLPSDP